MNGFHDTANAVATVIYTHTTEPHTSRTSNVRNDIYLVTETLRVMGKNHAVKFSPSDNAAILNYKKQLDNATKFIPDWMNVSVALAPGRRFGTGCRGHDRRGPMLSDSGVAGTMTANRSGLQVLPFGT